MTHDPTRPDGRETHGASTVRPVGGGGGAPPPKKRPKWLPWLLGALALLALILLLRSCGDREEEAEQVDVPPVTTSTTTTTAPTLPATAAPAAVVAGGMYGQLQQYLASAEGPGRRFTFDNLNFATSSAELPADANQSLQGLTQILNQYPNARVRIEGYADARGSTQSNTQLGAQRAEAVARALMGMGVAANRVETATGSETNPVDTNATAQGQAQNRRTDLVVVAK